MNIKLVKLITGEDIVCELTENYSETEVRMEEPIQLIPVPTEEKGMTLGMAPWMMASAVRSFVIKKSFIICITDVESGIKNHYNSQFGSGLVVPDDNPKIVS